ncbi:NADPH-dependent 7-cyano-7-deazaguanine reductase [Gracilariopsis chorda]|uniref:NADPH-dependent 7-cyano-7-deazaguanine reductase n=1 Tax=Gracilariopsis chorda TaxID=448386 RepID=A0A2V3IFU0_9FLOR|nr:NADPH-dependent 7-cyano-7-deazaguanine reductase [Gracilariopsis chorda]|eukprot:PXF40903.1 NADPH-dependent 7-cyano-7-deazaguanine reductase [Gracilariopsis chorda]
MIAATTGARIALVRGGGLRAICSRSRRDGQGGVVPALKHLGKTSHPPDSPSQDTLERVPNQHSTQKYCARFICPEFTSLCPVTSQPDFAHLVIDYVPNQWLVESKSLKLFLASFRNHQDFHEACTVSIANHLVRCAEPHWLRIGAYWYPRGGIPIDVFYSSGDPPPGVWIPHQAVPPYRGRG